jgi:hypothetical protein
MIRPEQFGVALDNEGNIIEGETKIVETQTVQTVTKEPSVTIPSVTLNELLDQYSAEAILQANGGTIPGTSEELARVANTLITNSQENGN